ncbi:ATP-binding domain-containing protein [Maribacter sp. 2210JD10-5]|uniref:nuclease-related domain-containing DEAD/DEAH box helicase n=1 Tax=Maribacter sp. 2210JD10-5 TaxID=3386272 RepID=UPI0039BD37B0
MATLIPTYDKILSSKVKPEEGELHLLKFLDSQLDNSFEVYFNPYMNGDRPDVVVMKKGQGVLIIEVKDYNLNSYELDERKNFVIKSTHAKTHKSPISQVLKYKDNLFELHIEKLLEKKIKDIRHFNTVSCCVYFHNANSNSINELLVEPFNHDKKYQTFLKYNINLIGRDNLNEFDLNKLLKKTYLKSNSPSFLFTDDIYKNIKRFLKPPLHLKTEGEDIAYSKKQLEIIYDATKKQQRIKGVVGSGKTTVLAARAVQAHKRNGGKVLILTYNITLRNFIRDKISKVREDFEWENFIISNYHLFINSELNNLGIDIEIPKDFSDYTEDQKDQYFERNYYSNKQLFIENRNEIKLYDVILIDEIQDYKRAWMEIVKECFLKEGGEYVLFGDVKQNIYNNKTDSKDISTNVKGVTDLKNCFRSDFKIKDLAIHYQQDIFKDKYEIDSFNKKQQSLEIAFERNQEGSINYIYLPKADSVSTLYTIIHENAINKDIPTNDITILGNSISLLKKFEAYYRYSSNERTNTMFETFEMVYRMGLNYLKNDKPEWLVNGIKLIHRQNDKSETRAFNQLSTLFTISDLYSEYPERFKEKLDIYCKKISSNSTYFLNYIEKYNEEISNFKRDYGPQRQTSNLKMIRNNKKIHFYMNSGTVKVSTVHSFKGWECETVFLILENYNFQMTFDEILYTGITRTRANLILINYGNEEYHNKLKDLIEKVK